MPQPHRLFFAVTPPAALRDRITALARGWQQAQGVGGRLLDSGRYHLTLQFLGGFGEAEPPQLPMALVAGNALRFTPFDVVLDQLGSFPRRQQSPFFIGCSQIPDALFALYGQIRSHLRAAGWTQPLGRGFVPHLTLAYGRHALAFPVAVPAMSFTVDSVQLYRSSTGQVPFALLGEWPAEAATPAA